MPVLPFSRVYPAGCDTCAAVADLRVDGKDFVELPRTSLEEMRREIRDIQNNTVVAPTMKLSDFVSTEKPVHKESKETTPHRPSVGTDVCGTHLGWCPSWFCGVCVYLPMPAKTTTPPKHAAPAPAPVHAPAPAPAHVPAPSADFDLFGGAPAAASGGWDPFDGGPFLLVFSMAASPC